MKKIRANKGRAGRIMPLAVAVVVFILSFWGVWERYQYGQKNAKKRAI